MEFKKKSNYASEDAGRKSISNSNDQINEIVNIVYDRVMKSINNKVDNTKPPESLSSTKKKVIDLELYGVICICKNFNDPYNDEYYEGFKHALYDNMCHFHKTVNAYEDFDEMRYVTSKYIKYEQMKNPGANIFDIFEPLFLDILVSAHRYASLLIFTEESKIIDDNKRVLNGIIFSFACDELSKDESRIVDYDFSNNSDASYLSEIGYVMKWTLRSTHDEYVKKYMPKRLNNIGDSSEENTIERINDTMNTSIKDHCSTAINITTGHKSKKQYTKSIKKKLLKCPNCRKYTLDVEGMKEKEIRKCPNCKTSYQIWVSGDDN